MSSAEQMNAVLGRPSTPQPPATKVERLVLPPLVGKSARTVEVEAVLRRECEIALEQAQPTKGPGAAYLAEGWAQARVALALVDQERAAQAEGVLAMALAFLTIGQREAAGNREAPEQATRLAKALGMKDTRGLTLVQVLRHPQEGTRAYLRDAIRTALEAKGLPVDTPAPPLQAKRRPPSP